MKSKTILCIPGTWRDNDHFMDALAAGTHGRFIAAGGRISDCETDYLCGYHIWPAAEGMEEAFRMGAAGAPLSEQRLAKIGQHSSYLSLYSTQDGAAEALAISEVALAALDCGGIAVRVEGSKRASGPDQWRSGVQNAQELFPELLYNLLVWAFVRDGDLFETVGMTFLGHPDISIDTTEFETASVVYNEFAKYMLFQNPEIRHGQTIGFEDTDGTWRISKVGHIYSDYPDIDFSRGMWRLRRIED